jgi:hypothetical protein
MGPEVRVLHSHGNMFELPPGSYLFPQHHNSPQRVPSSPKLRGIVYLGTDAAFKPMPSAEHQHKGPRGDRADSGVVCSRCTSGNCNRGVLGAKAETAGAVDRDARESLLGILKLFSGDLAGLDDITCIVVPEVAQRLHGSASPKKEAFLRFFYLSVCRGVWYTSKCARNSKAEVSGKN